MVINALGRRHTHRHTHTHTDTHTQTHTHILHIPMHEAKQFQETRRARACGPRAPGLKILTRFKFVGVVKIRQFNEFSSLPIFVLYIK